MDSTESLNILMTCSSVQSKAISYPFKFKAFANHEMANVDTLMKPESKKEGNIMGKR